VTKESGVKSKIKPPAPPAALQLDAKNFDDVVDGEKNLLVAFTAPWVGLLHHLSGRVMLMIPTVWALQGLSPIILVEGGTPR